MAPKKRMPGRPQSLKVLEAKPTGPLYHYTSHHGLLGILRSREIWATNVLYLNDRDEFFHGIEIAAKVADDLRQRCKDSPDDTRYYSEIVELLRDRKPRSLASDIFVACFCEERDELSLWRGYAPAGTGYCLGIDWRPDTNPNLILTKCLYEKSAQEDVVRYYLDEFRLMPSSSVLGYYLRSREFDPQWLQKKLPLVRAMEFAKRISMVSLAMKHPAFRDEREWRIVYFKPNKAWQPQYRTGANSLIPYASVAIPTRENVARIDEIMVGPTFHPAEAIDSVRGLLETLPDIECPSIRGSTIPLRMG